MALSGGMRVCRIELYMTNMSSSTAVELMRQTTLLSDRPSLVRKSSNRTRAKILSVLMSSVLTLLVGELLVRFIWRTARPEFVVDEELLWGNRPNQCLRLGSLDGQESREMTIDERGLRRTLPDRSGAERRLVVLGDSAMFGALLDDGETFSSQLQSLVGDSIQVINTGVGGWGLFQEEKFLRREVDRLHPDIVLVHQQSLDVTRQPFPESQWLRKAAFMWECRIAHAVRHYSKLATTIAHLARKVILGRSIRGVVNEVVDERGSNGEGPTPAFLECWKKDCDRLVAMKELAERHGAKFVMLTGGPRDHTRSCNGQPNTQFFLREMSEFCRSHGIVEIKMTGQLQDYDLESLTFLPVDGHPSPLWNRLTAAESYRVLKSAGLLEETRLVATDR